MTRRSSRVLEVIGREAPSFFRLESIRSRIVLFAVLAALIPALSMAWLAYVQNKRSLAEKTAEELRRSASQMARELDLWLKEHLYDVRVFASSYEVVENLDRVPRAGTTTPRAREAQARLSEYLTSVHRRFPDYDQLLVLGADGEAVARSGTESDSLGLPADWHSRVESDQAVLGDPHWDPTLEKPVLAMAVPITAPDTRVLGALAARLELQALGPLLEELEPGETGAVYVITDDGVPVVSSREAPPALKGTTLPPASLETLRAADTSAVEYRSFSGSDAVGAYGAVPRLRWAVVAEIPRQEAFGQIADLRNQTLALVLAVVLAVGLVAYWLGLLIVRPLDRLTRGAVEVAEGDLKVDLPPTGGGEVGRLTEVFNFMVGRLRAGREELDRANETLRRQNEQLEVLSVTDGLTDLYNRRYLIGTLEQELRRSDRTRNPFAVVIMDVDHFKRVNDTHGHQAGDAVLVAVARIVRETVRQVDTAARYGGEEFVALLPETDAEGAAEVAERIRTAVAAHVVRANSTKISVTVSLGVAGYPADGGDVDTVMSAADGALYQAKEAGRNRVVRVGENPPPVKKTGAKRKSGRKTTG